MSSKAQKTMKKSAKCRRVDKTLPSDDWNPEAANPDAADNPAVGTSEMGGRSSRSDMQQAREPIQKRMQEYEGDVTSFLKEKRKQFKEDVNESFRILNENLQGILKAREQSRQELKSIYCETFGSLYQKWLDEVGSTKDQEEHLSFLTQQQLKILQTAIEDHKTKLEDAKDMCDNVLKKAKDLSKHGKTFIGGQKTKVEKEISKVQDRVIMETQEQDVSVLETYVQSLISEDAI